MFSVPTKTFRLVPLLCLVASSCGVFGGGDDGAVFESEVASTLGVKTSELWGDVSAFDFDGFIESASQREEAVSLCMQGSGFEYDPTIETTLAGLPLFEREAVEKFGLGVTTTKYTPQQLGESGAQGLELSADPNGAVVEALTVEQQQAYGEAQITCNAAAVSDETASTLVNFDSELGPEFDAMKVQVTSDWRSSQKSQEVHKCVRGKGYNSPVLWVGVSDVWFSHFGNDITAVSDADQQAWEELQEEVLLDGQVVFTESALTELIELQSKEIKFATAVLDMQAARSQSFRK